MADRELIVGQIIEQAGGVTKAPEESQPVAKMPLIVNKENQPRKVRANLTKLLTYYDDNLADLFIYNEATHNVEIIEDRAIGYHTLKKGALNDTAIKQIASYIANQYLLDYSNHDIADEIEAVAITRSYHPIKTFLTQALAEKLDRDPFEIVREYLNIDDTPYNRLALDLFFRGAIARVFVPGCQFDFCLDLVGQQGGRKTTFLRQVFMAWYTDQIRSFDQKDDIALMIQSWLVNDEELEASNRLTFGGLKKAITVTVVSFRPPYARAAISLPVDFVFSRTTNEAEHLGDATGDRRFLGVEVKKTTPKHKKAMTTSDLRDIWGNYYASYLKNPKLYYDEDSPEYSLIEAEREKFKKVDDVLDLLTWYIDQPIPRDFFSPNTEAYQRREYYNQLLSTGIAYKCRYDQKTRQEWRGELPRDRLAIPDVISELFFDQTKDKTIKRKIRLYMENLPDWVKKKNIKFGHRQTSGYVKK